MLGTLSMSLWLAASQLISHQEPPFAVYRPVLEHVTREWPVRLLRPVTLNRAVYRSNCHFHCGGDGQNHAALVLTGLRRARLVAGWCDVPTARVSCGPSRNIFVSLGPVISITRGVRVPATMNLPPGRPLPDILAAIPDSAKVSAHAAVDLLLYVPCTAAPDSERCAQPDIVMYRYYLEHDGSGGYRVVSRLMTGAV
jgi:hypothetical protein